MVSLKMLTKIKRRQMMTQKIEETYKDQFKPMVEHQDAILILSSEEDSLFLEKHIASIKANRFLEDLVGKKFKSF